MSFVGFVLFLFLALVAVATWLLLRDYQEYLKFYSFMEAINGKIRNKERTEIIYNLKFSK